MNIIGDIAGNFKTLLALLKQMPDDPVLSVGDLIDRGPRSKQVIDWFMANKAQAILGNHELLMIDAVAQTRLDATFSWIGTGGIPTLESFQVEPDELDKIPQDVVMWLKSLPLFIEQDDLFVSHAPVSSPALIPRDPLAADFRVQRHKFVWNRLAPARIGNKFHLFGHNSHIGLKHYSDARGDYALCIDTSYDSILTGFHWPSRKIYQQPYID